jgi:hypothetical protein
MDAPRQPGPRRTPPYFAAAGLVAVSLAVVGTLLTAPAHAAHATTPTAGPTVASFVVG